MNWDVRKGYRTACTGDIAFATRIRSMESRQSHYYNNPCLGPLPGPVIKFSEWLSGYRDTLRKQLAEPRRCS